MDRVWQWAWDRYGPRYTWAVYLLSLPLLLPIWLVVSFYIVAFEKSDHYLSTRPEFLVADEAVSSLDVSAAAEILNLIIARREALGFTALFVTHNLSVAKVVADRVAIMRKGEIVEEGTPADIFSAPKHEYTALLLESHLALPGGELATTTAEDQ
jgi:ABC-type Fe3+/spermidine/putrescine transport system ATPase subunit